VFRTVETVLVVDDEERIRTSTSFALEEMGYVVRSAEDGLSALRDIRQERPDILLSDLNMPGMSGFELLREVRRSFPAIRMIAMSGAFCGNEVPVGIFADAFYQKGSGMSALLRLLQSDATNESPSVRMSREPTPLFVGGTAALSSTEASD
jgi:CheY-like chemotaxis protein